MNKKEFLTFLTSAEAPPEDFRELARRDIVLGFRGKTILSKFLFFQLLGALFSLSICPQFGLGLVEGHGVTHFFRSVGDWACALFCGVVFFSSGALVAYLGLKGEELWWVWRRYKSPLMLLPALLWGVLMLANISLDLTGETITYHLVWLAAAGMAQFVWLKLRSGLYLWQFHQETWGKA